MENVRDTLHAQGESEVTRRAVIWGRCGSHAYELGGICYEKSSDNHFTG